MLKLERRADVQVEFLLTVGRYLLNRPVAEQHEFLCGIPEGFILFLNRDGGYTGQRRRTELYLMLMMLWPEITEMQKSDPPKTCKFLLDWLEKKGRRSNWLTMKSCFTVYVGKSVW